MSQVMFYSRPEPLNKEKHLSLKLNTSQANLTFATRTNSVLLAGAEFQHAAKEYPIVFLQGGNGELLAAALLGVRNDENLFVDATGRWSANYIPAFVRRYPFILAESEATPGQLTVCLDADYPGFNNEEGEPLFEPNGEPSTLMNNAIRFLKDCQEGYQRTALFIEHLKELDLFVTLSARLETPQGQKFAIQGIMTVDEKKLHALEESQVMALFRSGELAWIHAHLISLSNISRLANLLSARDQAAAQG
ncbi:MAG: SapC family protein [Magnetococcales bacterium]|nr:SapC family protein [Magnetococcales bacterium]